MFFSLSLGMGIMITYGSYLDKKQNVEKNALVIVVVRHPDRPDGRSVP